MTRRKPPAEPVIRTCADPKCGRPFPVHRDWQRFCSKRCRERVLHEQMRRDARSHRTQLQQQPLCPEAAGPG
jgi:predicted nucleic acid-binding Zn ribbon protein